MSENVNYWKIGSRWSKDGNSQSSILDVFRRNKVIFVGTKTDELNKVKIGDFVAISDGKKIVSVAKVLDNPKQITEFDIFETDKNRFDYEDWVYGVKVNIIDLKNSIPYRIGEFHRLNKYRKELREFYEISNKEFNIEAKTCTLFNNIQPEKSIFRKDIKYEIPIYQRPYSWEENQIKKFISDIFNSYKEKEPIFFGTMQFSEKKIIDEKNYIQEVIDGQQRITTCILFLKILSLENYEIKNKYNWVFNNFNTLVNNGYQYDEFVEILDIKSKEEIEIFTNVNSKNKYITNLFLLNSLYNNFKNEEYNDDETIDFNLIDFIDNHLFKNLHFVVIETKAGLSKTLQIFDTINTTGLDLKGADIFKLRMFEYLTDIKGNENDVFENINEIYKKLDKLKEITNINQILSIYQVYLIGKYDLSSVLYTYNVNTFFEKLFDQILNINNHLYFDKVIENKVELSLKDLENIIEARKQFNDNPFERINACEYNLIFHSRYSRYWIWLQIFNLKFKDELDFLDKRNIFLSKLSKLLCLYSVYYSKSINEIHSFMRNLNKNILFENKSYIDVCNKLEEKIKSKKNDFENNFSKPISGNAKWKNIICRTSAMLEDKENEKLKELLFGNIKIDIEHIQCFTDEKNAIEVRRTWGNTLNSIGNLIILEDNLNRAIKNDSSKKVENYNKSHFKIVQNFIEKGFVPTNWSKEKAEERQKIEIEKLKNYYF